MSDNAITTRVNKIWLDSNNIIRINTEQGANVVLEDVEAVKAACLKVRVHNKHPILSDVRGLKSVTQEARKKSADESIEEYTSAFGILVDSPITQIMGNFFVNFTKPPFPTKMFFNENKAIAWLKQYL